MCALSSQYASKYAIDSTDIRFMIVVVVCLFLCLFLQLIVNCQSVDCKVMVVEQRLHQVTKVFFQIIQTQSKAREIALDFIPHIATTFHLIG